MLNQSLNKNHPMLNKLEVIDGLRGMAIFMVLYYHIFGGLALSLIDKIQINFEAWKWLAIFSLGGWAGVPLFFILSGFVLFKPYFLRERVFESRQDIINFYKRRFFRLYPLLVFSCLISFFFILNPSWLSFKSLILTLSTLSIFTVNGFVPVLNTVLWSLVVEIWFSLLFPFIVFLLNKYSFKKIGFFIFIIALFTRLIGYYFFSSVSLNFVKDGFLGHLDDFFWGIFICKLYCENNKVFSMNSFAWLLLSFFFFFLGSFVGILVLWGMISIYFYAFVYNIIQLSFLCLIISAFNLKSFMNLFFKMWWLRILGSMCFSIYVWHALLMKVFLVADDLNLKNLLIYCGFMLFFAGLSYRYLEFGKERSLKKLFLLE